MVSLKSVAAAALAAVPFSSAYIAGFTAPASAGAGSTFNATLDTASYSQNWDDFGIIWGLATPEYDCDTCVGTQIGFTIIDGTEGLTYPYTFTDAVTIPVGTSAGSYILKAAIPRLIGVSNGAVREGCTPLCWLIGQVNSTQRRG